MKKSEMTPEMLKELAFTQEEIDELNRSREMPIAFDEDSPETTPEKAVRFYRVNPPNKTVKGTDKMCDAMDGISEKRAEEAVINDRYETARLLWNNGEHDYDKISRIARLTLEQVREALGEHSALGNLGADIAVKEESALQKRNSSYENAECSRMVIIKELADAADMIVSGYAFTRLPDGYRVVNLNQLESVALFSKDGDVIETSMCDIETTIALKCFEKNRKLIDD